MPSKLSSFGVMWSAYPAPSGGADEAKAIIGGAANAGWITNTCVLRISRALNAAGFKIPLGYPGLATVAGSDGLRYAFRVEEFRKYMVAVYGVPDLTFDGVAPGGGAPASLQGKQGVIAFIVTGWSDATGHFDLWNGERCAHAEYFARASRVLLWSVAGGAPAPLPEPTPAPAPALGASVGQGGANRRADVEIVQRLLVSHGEDVGTVDGLCGPRTIAAIRAFQRGFLTSPDGRVDPGGRTFRELCRL